MRIKSVCRVAIFFTVPTIASAYPLDDAAFLTSAYCYHMSKAPRFEVDLSQSEKESGAHQLFEELHARNLEFPKDEEYNL